MIINDSRCAPRLSPEASEKLSSHFVSIRKRVHQAELDANARSSIPITVRQLEAVIRITESLAKLSLSPVATEEHVDEAVRLFLASTMDAAVHGDGQASKELSAEVSKIEDELKRRLPIGWTTSLATLRREFVDGLIDCPGVSIVDLARPISPQHNRKSLTVTSSNIRE
ncbi:hypothetical protein H105_04495 [Trichophyton soudanense CBS 452.61]|uniref:DNA replication licensing factor MCM5 n=1 Tax=Trichophyton soudanense CBS 452.61 TaxID=1215331 RepID=A0A022XT59_TRISD|nr:hypothetical protein H105_04495 [Trichophyton soudanense CBS 452.61]